RNVLRPDARPSRSRIVRRWLVTVATAIACGTPAFVNAQPQDDGWKWSLSPYLWLPTIHGRVNHDMSPGGGAPGVSIGATDWFDLLNFGALLSVTATKGRYAVLTDFVYLNMKGDNGGRLVSVEGGVSGPGGVIEVPVSADANINTEFELDGFQWMLGLGYAFAESASGTHYVFAGVRLLSADVSTAWALAGSINGPGGETLLDQQGGISTSVRLWDGIIGLKGSVKLGGGNWSAGYGLDVGAGDSDLVWNAMTTL